MSENGVTVTGNDIHDIRQKVGARANNGDISIRFRRNDYGRNAVRGCIVDAVGLGQVAHPVPMFFETPKHAVRYIAKLLNEQDAWVRGQIKEEQAKISKAKKEAKK